MQKERRGDEDDEKEEFRQKGRSQRRFVDVKRREGTKRRKLQSYSKQFNWNRIVILKMDERLSNKKNTLWIQYLKTVKDDGSVTVHF